MTEAAAYWAGKIEVPARPLTPLTEKQLERLQRAEERKQEIDQVIHQALWHDGDQHVDIGYRRHNAHFVEFRFDRETVRRVCVFIETILGKPTWSH
jgi:hypothetical protein